jgi:DNA polymerase-3 subunit beta
MQFTVKREDILKPIQSILGVVEKRHTMAILGNVKLTVKESVLVLTATDLEVELVAKVPLQGESEEGVITVPARKLSDICRNLPDEASISLKLDGNRPVVTSGKSRFLLSSMPANNFPTIESNLTDKHVTLTHQEMTGLLRKTQFAMAQQDVRYFLNGMLFEVSKELLRVVATDGHRLAMSTIEKTFEHAPDAQVIVPRKAIVELLRLLTDSDELLTIVFGDKHAKFEMSDYTFTTKLLEGRYPDYARVIPAQGKNIMHANSSTLKHALTRAAILSNEQYRGVRLQFKTGSLHLTANNPEHEEAQDEIEVNYSGKDLEMGFNVSYLLDVLSVNNEGDVQVSVEDSNSSALIRAANDDGSLFVVMPIRL